MILIGDVREKLSELESRTIQTCITSPPYWGLRDYGNDNQIGLEKSPDEYVSELVSVFREVKRVLRDDGTLWLNIGDSYSGSGKNPAGNLGKTNNERDMEDKHSAVVPLGMKPKDLVGIPWMVAFALRADGWYLRQDIIWAKPNPMPESVKDRCTKSHEYLLTKSSRYYYDNGAIKEPATTGYSSDQFIPNSAKDLLDASQKMNSAQGDSEKYRNSEWLMTRNKRDVWTINTKPFKGAHFAVMPEALVEPCILAGSKDGDVVLDPFMGSGTVGVVALRHNRDFIGVELNPVYAELARDRINNSASVIPSFKSGTNG